MPSSGQCTASVMTSHPAAGPGATATSPASTRQSSACACLSPELALTVPDPADVAQADGQLHNLSHDNEDQVNGSDIVIGTDT